MADPITLEDNKPVEEAPKVEEKKEDKPYINKIRHSSFTQLATQKPEEEKANTLAPEEKPKEEEPKTEDKPVSAPDLEAIKKEQADLAAKAAEEALTKQRELEKKEREEAKKAEEAKLEEEKRKEALKPKFTGKDKDGNPVPKSYEELAEESARIGREQALAEFEEKQRWEKEQARAAEAEKAKQEEEARQRMEEQSRALQSQIDEEVNELYSSGKLPRVVNKDDPNDPGNLALAELFKQGAELNQQRAKEGKPLITSLSRIYAVYYKPPKPPAGADAPIQGNGQAPSTTEPKGYNFREYHRMPVSTFLKKVAEKAKAN